MFCLRHPNAKPEMSHLGRYCPNCLREGGMVAPTGCDHCDRGHKPVEGHMGYMIHDFGMDEVWACRKPRNYGPKLAEQIYYGFYESHAEDAKPEYDPGLAAPCPFCGKPISSDDVRTHCLMYSAGSYAKRSYFYRTHRTCAEKDQTHTAMDNFILEMIARNGD